MTLDDYIAAYGGLLARRRMLALWQAERGGAGLAFGEGGEAGCLSALRAACERLGLPCGGEDVNLDGLADLELALVCDCFGDAAFGAEPTPRLASFRYMRGFLFGRLRNHHPAKAGVSELSLVLGAERRRMLDEDDVASFCMGRELMGEVFKEPELNYLLRNGKVEILRAGTSFIPVFDYVRSHGMRPDVLVYVTDGYGDAPQKAPPYPVLWVLTSDGTEKFATWGQKIHLNPATN